MPVFSVEDLRVAFGTKEAVRGVSFSVEPGKTLAIVGESGSGKSVSLLGATGLLPRSSLVTGSAVHQGQQLLGLSGRSLRKKRGAEIGFVFQDPLSNLHPLKTIGVQIGEAIMAHQRIGRRALRDRVLSLLDDVGIHNPSARIDDYPRHFSGGMRQRVMIAIAIALNPGLIIADEPTTALDVTVQASILDLLKRIQEDHGSAMIFVSHDLAVVSDIADDVVVMKDGYVVEHAAKGVIYRTPQHAYTRELLGAARLGRMITKRADVQASTPKLLTVSNISRSFHGRNRDGVLIKPVLTDISFSVRENEIVGLVGESGSGKSTIGRLITCLDRPDQGTISLRDEIYSRPGTGGVAIDKSLRSSIQMVFQDPYTSLNPRRKIGAILAEPFLINTKLNAGAIRQRVRELLRSVELSEDLFEKFPSQLSGGQRQRVAIARAIALEPTLIIADEPVSALDITTQAKIIALLQSLKDRLKVSFLFISHDLGVVSELCDRVIVLDRGKIVEAGGTAAVFNAPQNAYTKKLIGAIPGRQRTEVGKREYAHVL